MKIKNIILLVIIGLLIIISTQNTQEVTIKYLFWEMNIPLIVLVYAAIIISFLLGIIYSGLKRISKDRALRKKLKINNKDNFAKPNTLSF